MSGLDDIKVRLPKILEGVQLDLEGAHFQMRTWFAEFQSSGQDLWIAHATVMRSMFVCVETELQLASGAFMRVTQEISKYSEDDQKRMRIAYYLLFGLIDKTAQQLKARLSIRTPGIAEMAAMGRQSLHLHWRVLKLIDQCPILKETYHSSVERMRKALEAQAREGWDVFVAHSSVESDKRAVLEVLDLWKARGEAALQRIKDLVHNFAEDPGDLATLERDFHQEQEQLGVLTLRDWLDQDKMIPGDIADEIIPDVIRKTRVVLIFYTPNYDNAWYLRNRERPEIRDHLQQRSKEGLRAIPVVLCPRAWRDYKVEWVTEKDPITCPMNLHRLEENIDLQKLRSLAVDGLANVRLLKAITGELDG
jgi:hypothetical protein